MSEMIDRVALAIHRKHNSPDDGKYWFHEDARRCELSRQLAQAAIEAMRGPTDAMVAHAFECDGPPTITWEAMIDAALAVGQTK